MRVFRLIFITGYCSLSCLTLLAQPGDPGGGNPTVPITGIEILVVAGGVLGIKRMFPKRKN